MRKLMLSNDKIYLISRFINLIGSNIYNICIPLYLLEKFGSLTITGIFFYIGSDTNDCNAALYWRASKK